MTVIKLPMFSSARVLADRLVREFVAAGVTKDVSIDGRDLDTSTESFADQLGRDLKANHVSHVTLIGGGKDWVAKFEKAAQPLDIVIAVKDPSSV